MKTREQHDAEIKAIDEEIAALVNKKDAFEKAYQKQLEAVERSESKEIVEEMVSRGFSYYPVQDELEYHYNGFRILHQPRTSRTQNSVITVSVELRLGSHAKSVIEIMSEIAETIRK